LLVLTLKRVALLTMAISGSTILMTTWACSNAYANCGFWRSIFLASTGLFWMHC